MLILAIGSIVTVGGLSLVLFAMAGGFGHTVKDKELVVYCAAGMKKPVEDAVAAYEKEFGVNVRLIYGNSGFLIGQIALRREGDLYIPADFSYVEQGRAYVNEQTKQPEPLVAEAVALAKFRLCIAVQPGNPRGIKSIDDLLLPDVSFSRAAPKAGVGKKTKTLLAKAGRWDGIQAATKVEKQTVNEVCQDVQTESVDAGLVWDTVAKQYGLDVVNVPEFDAGVATIQAAVLTDSAQPAAALRFARYLAAPEKGKQYFDKHGYEQTPGDKWVVRPKVTLFSGTVSRPAIEQTLETFRLREGVDVSVVFAGCGNLVGIMKTDQLPDAYLACDISYEPWMKDSFGEPTIVSEMDMVMLVKPGNPHGIATLADLAKPGLKIGIANPKHSALGGVTKALLERHGLYDAVFENVRANNPGGDLLVQNLIGSKTLDAVIVYGANCLHVGDDGQIVPIPVDDAVAVQPWWQRKDVDYPQLTGRLFEAITSGAGKRQYVDAGFRFRAGTSADAQGP